MKLQPEQLKLF